MRAELAIEDLAPGGEGVGRVGGRTVFVPWTAFKEHLSPQGIALFGGERPAEDAKNF